MCQISAAAALLPGPALAHKTIIVPYSATFTSQGMVLNGVDDLDIFGGGDLSGTPYSNSITVVYPGIPYKAIRGLPIVHFGGFATDTISMNGISFSFGGNGYFGNFTYHGSDQRIGNIYEFGGVYNDILSHEQALRFPSTWTTPSERSVFSNDTVINQFSMGVYCTLSHNFYRPCHA
jgi:hypothetical protein